MKVKKILVFVITLGVIFFSAGINHCLAQGIGGAEGRLQQVNKYTGYDQQVTVGSIAGTVIGSVLTMVGVLFLGLMVYGGVLWMTARGEEEQVKKAQKVIVSSIVGLFIIVSAYAITFFVMSRFETVG